MSSRHSSQESSCAVILTFFIIPDCLTVGDERAKLEHNQSSFEWENWKETANQASLHYVELPTLQSWQVEEVYRNRQECKIRHKPVTEQSKNRHLPCLPLYLNRQLCPAWLVLLCRFLHYIAVSVFALHSKCCRVLYNCSNYLDRSILDTTEVYNNSVWKSVNGK